MPLLSMQYLMVFLTVINGQSLPSEQFVLYGLYDLNEKLGKTLLKIEFTNNFSFIGLLVLAGELL